MIRLGFMTDAARVIGASDDEGTSQRFNVLPPALKVEMAAVYDVGYVVVGRPSIGPWMRRTATHVFVLSRDPEFSASAGHVEVVSGADRLIERFAHSAEEDLLVAGGLGVFRLFLPHARMLDVAQTDKLVPGDLVFDEWEPDFVVDRELRWQGGVTRRYVRRAAR